ncbi:recombinase RecT [Agrobacterium tumefaciens]|uniref:Recombinase RecT n=1 Tax=Agrobacterium tumefaciens TaxID=358 RepID=A0AAP9E314_AGRTU|nr:recombinase RecT [Agrobacterium tumefaciens]NSZ57817.1 recombinase RecT [Agrobacterium tumefaciens]QDY93936.1 recombinase RecT [Agrobacterium tumefaciens]UXS49008.1 recombinase RecT [Agrobacterium tumefaciens]UXS70312.1 recombinase RecT [Agrobacterium tumefaciens]UXS77974.1 recombinase RecT [Agrobacterium tumefaciens]
MNQIATQQQRVPMDSVGVTSSLTGSKIAPQNLGEVVKFAEVMARADIALPKHLRGNAGACMAVALQAMEWNLSPFAVASKSYAVNGAIAYEAQLIAAVVNTRSGIKGRLKYRYEGEGPSLTCTVTGTLDGEECTYTSPPMGSITTKNSPLWKSDPQQQLGYFAARSWARRHCPEVILGVYDRDEAEEFRGPDNAKNITPVFDPLSDEPVATQRPTDEQQTVDGTIDTDESNDALTGEIIDNTPSDDTPPAPASSADEAGAESPSDAPASTDPERDILIRFAAEMLPMAATAPTEAWKEVEKGWSEGEMKTLSDAGKAKAKSISQSIRAIAAGNVSLESAAGFHAEMLECKASDLGGVDG